MKTFEHKSDALKYIEEGLGVPGEILEFSVPEEVEVIRSKRCPECGEYFEYDSKYCDFCGCNGCDEFPRVDGEKHCRDCIERLRGLVYPATVIDVE